MMRRFYALDARPQADLALVGEKKNAEHGGRRTSTTARRNLGRESVPTS